MSGTLLLSLPFSSDQNYTWTTTDHLGSEKVLPVPKRVYFLLGTHQQSDDEDGRASGQQNLKDRHVLFSQDLGKGQHGS